MDNNTQQFSQTQPTQGSAPLMPEPIANGSLGQSGMSPFVTQQNSFQPVGATPAPQPQPAASGVYTIEQPNTDDTTNFQDTQQEPAQDSGATDSAQPVDTDTPSELLEIKQQALGQLSPLVNQLDQTPEDRFRTLMMLIQASDDQTLIPKAYEAAQSITDEKAKAQALLDIVNEINYFSHSKKA